MHSIIFVLIRRLQLPLIVLICINAISMLGFVLIPGTDDQGQAWRMDFFHAFYFVSFMGTTIGFGEIPFAFNDAQRLWATFTIYGTVIAWLYAIGSIFSLIQDPAFRALGTENAFRRGVRRIKEPFYLVCGYGDTGSFLVRTLTETGIRSVVVDSKQNRLIELETGGLPIHIPGICANASEPDVLLMAGLKNPTCAGVIALTNDDHINLKISITSKLLNPGLPVIARAETHDVEVNIASFGTENIINPFDTFAGRLALAVHSPGIYLLYEWMTGVPYEHLSEPLFLPHGTWVLCGYGRFGQSVYDRLRREGVHTTVIEAKPEITGGLPEGAVIGRGTEAVTLEEANIRDAVGIIAGTDDDANNLSIIMTARQLNPKLFLIARQNQRRNDANFSAARLDLIMSRGNIIAHKIFALITVPVLGNFLAHARLQNNDWANELVSRISGVIDDEAPHNWMIEVDQNDSPALLMGIVEGKKILVRHLLCDPRNRDNRLPCILLFIKRGELEILLPEENAVLMEGDKILMCGQYGVKRQVDWSIKNKNVFDYIYTGKEQSSGYLAQWVARKNNKTKKPSR